MGWRRRKGRVYRAECSTFLYAWMCWSLEGVDNRHGGCLVRVWLALLVSDWLAMLAAPLWPIGGLGGYHRAPSRLASPERDGETSDQTKAQPEGGLQQTHVVADHSWRVKVAALPPPVVSCPPPPQPAKLAWPEICLDDRRPARALAGVQLASRWATAPTTRPKELLGGFGGRPALPNG